MALTTDQLNQLIKTYAERCVNDMDTKCLEQFVYDTIVENLSHMGEEDVMDQLYGVYDDEVIQEMVESVTAG
jgi:ribonucleotide reductase alpha subunit